MVLIILGREIIITGLRGIASSEGIVIAASDLGKFKTIFQIVAILGLLLHYDYCWFFGINHPLLIVNMHNIGMFYLWIATVLTVWSGIDYLWRFMRVIAK
jgi:CDP-diacylglycerol--glycerol-3-phosphate 3-phosphatidyltransferase